LIISERYFHKMAMLTLFATWHKIHVNFGPNIKLNVSFHVPNIEFYIIKVDSIMNTIAINQAMDQSERQRDKRVQ